MASGEIHTSVDTIGYMAEEAMRLAILKAVKEAEGINNIKAYKDINM